jgi:hypothetical protein
MAFALGIATNELSSGKRLNLIAFPLLGMLAWNMAVYVGLAADRFRRVFRRHAPPSDGNRLSRLANRLAGLSSLHGDTHQPLGRALARFAADWARHARPLTAARVSRTLHLGAAAFACGAIAGMYLRALGIEYRAGWESTFLAPEAVHRLLAFALGPASTLTGTPLPGPAQLAQLRWSAGTGENAGPWIHRYAATAFLIILVPRLVLAMSSVAVAARLRRRFRVPGREDFHVRRILRTAHGGSVEVRIVPYGYSPAQLTRQALSGLMVAALGDGTRTRFDTPITYGGEDEWLAVSGAGATEDHILVLFNLASTPEAENHGALLAGVRQVLQQGRSGTALACLVDEAPYRERLAGQAAAAARIGTRRAAWEAMAAAHGMHPFFADLGDDTDAGLVKRLESALVQAPDLIPEKARG